MMINKYLLVGLTGALFNFSAAQAAVIDFSTVVIPDSGATLPPGDYVSTNAYVPFVANGFKFEDQQEGHYLVSGSMGGHFVVPTGHDMYAIFLHGSGGGKFYAADGGSFTLNSLNMNWWDSVWDTTRHFYSVTGTFVDGSTQSVSGGVDPGQYIPLTLNWTGLKSVSVAGNAGAAWDGGGFIGISDVTVNLPVPEPETYAMMMTGLGMLGLVVRRRSRKAA
jgi:hypothetical protein